MKLTVAIVAVVLLWAGFAYTTAQPTDAQSYTRAAMQVAQSAHDAAATVALTARLQRAGKIFPPFSTTAYDDATKGLAGAAKQLTEQVPPDEATAALRDRLAPLLQTEAKALGDATAAQDDHDLTTAIGSLDDVAGHLEKLINQ